MAQRDEIASDLIQRLRLAEERIRLLEHGIGVFLGTGHELDESRTWFLDDDCMTLARLTVLLPESPAAASGSAENGASPEG